MLYAYEDLQTGEVVELNKSMHDFDSLGTVITHEGRQLRRILSDPAINVPVKDEPRSRRSLAKNMPGFEKYDHRGYPVATNAELKKKGFVENPHLDNPLWK